MSGTAWLLLIFIVLPIVVTPFVVSFVARRSPDVPVEHRTSWLLDHGEPMEATLVSWKNKGPFMLDGHPMVAFKLDVDGAPVDITQPVSRAVVSRLSEGMTLDVRVSPDRRAGAIVLPEN